MSLKNLNCLIKHQRLVADAYIHMDTIGTGILNQLTMNGTLVSVHSFNTADSANISVGTFKYAVLIVTFIAYGNSHPLWIPSPTIVVGPSMTQFVIGGPTGDTYSDLSREGAYVSSTVTTITITVDNPGASTASHISGTLLVFN